MSLSVTPESNGIPQQGLTRAAETYIRLAETGPPIELGAYVGMVVDSRLQPSHPMEKTRFHFACGSSRTKDTPFLGRATEDHGDLTLRNGAPNRV